MRIVINRIQSGMEKPQYEKAMNILSLMALAQPKSRTLPLTLKTSVESRKSAYQKVGSMRKLLKLALLIYFVCVTSVFADPGPLAQEQRQLLQLIEYIGVDYNAAVVAGQVVDQGEYREMQDFSAIIAGKSELLFSKKPVLLDLSQKLKLAVEEKQSSRQIQQIVAQLKQQLLQNLPELSLPKSLLPMAEVKPLFQEHCAACHGVQGKGDGLSANQMFPSPTDFTDRKRAINRSILGLFGTITGGLEGTAMPSFSQLDSQQRWSIAFFVGSMAFTGESKATRNQRIELAQLVNFSPNEIINSNQTITLTDVEQSRANPWPLFELKKAPLTIAKNQLAAAWFAYQKKDYQQAKTRAVSAYLDGFELIENSLDTRDKALRKEIEGKLLGLRQAFDKHSNLSEVETIVFDTQQLMRRASRLLNESSMSSTTLFGASFIILLREGLEALLVVLALLTILMRSDKQQAIKYLHFGWVSALVAGVATWLVAQYLIAISGASREIMEGVAALLAAVVLFYVGFWMHNKSQAAQWQKYIKQNIDRSLNAGTLWGISGLAFIAVYREVFETVLFYQSLLTQISSSQNLIFASGFLTAILLLTLLTWLMLRYSIKLPIGKFLSTTTYLLLTLSFVLMGKAISALQEAAIISITPMSIDFQVDWLGINSTWQGVASQLAILVISLLLIFRKQTKISSLTSKL